MKYITFFLLLMLCFSTFGYSSDDSNQNRTSAVRSPRQAASSFWVTGYIASWTLNMGSGTDGNYGNMPYQAVDLDAMTHVVMFAAAIQSDGSLKYNNIVPSRRKSFNDYVHSKGKPIILSVGGAGNTAFSTAITPAYRSTLIYNLMDAIRTYEYDGIDIDIEPVNTSDTANISLFIKELYNSLQAHHSYYDVSKKPYLTCAIYNFPNLWGRLSQYFDQINLMSYDFFGTWFGKSWHNNAPSAPASDVDIYGVVMTTVQSKMQRFLDAGIPKNKFGVGIDFNGWVWQGGLLADGSGNGITAPRQKWTTAPTVVGGKETQYYVLRKKYIDTATVSYHYDNVCKVPYIGIDKAGNTLDLYITYQDTSTISEIVNLTKQNGIGGLILWEVGGGYLGTTDFPTITYPNLVRDPLLRAVKKATGSLTPPPPKVQPRIRGEIFYDREPNGVKNSTDPLLSGWKINLFGPEGQQTAVTDSSGKYEFDSLQTGDHIVTIDVKNLWRPTFPLPAGQITYTTQLLNDTSVSVCDFGLYASNVKSTQYGFGWNAVSLPLNVPDPRTEIVFPLALSSAFLYLNSYLSEDSLRVGKGYLIKFRSNHTLWTAGYNVDSIVIPVNEGWNIIGSISTPVPLSYVHTFPSGILTSPIYSFDNSGYGFVDSIIPGKGYWIKTSQGGEIHLSISANQSFKKFEDIKSLTELMHSITFQSASAESRKIYFANGDLENQSNYESFFELPPFQDFGDFFDVRFNTDESSNGGLLGFFNSGVTAEDKLPISVTAARYPLSLRYNIENETEYRYEIETSDNTIYPLVNNVEIQIKKPIGQSALSTELIWLKQKPVKMISQQPQKLSLDQNYPNPFNGGTVITFSLPTDGNVRLEIYNILGERVAVLANGEMNAGDHTQIFEGNNLPSGLYLYKISYRDKSHSYSTETKRMLLLK